MIPVDDQNIDKGCSREVIKTETEVELTMHVDVALAWSCSPWSNDLPCIGSYRCVYSFELGMYLCWTGNCAGM